MLSSSHPSNKSPSKPKVGKVEKEKLVYRNKKEVQIRGSNIVEYMNVK